MKRNQKLVTLTKEQERQIQGGVVEKIWVFLNEAKVKGKKMNDLKKGALDSCKLLKGCLGGAQMRKCPGSNPFEMPYEEQLHHCPGSLPRERPY